MWRRGSSKRVRRGMQGAIVLAMGLAWAGATLAHTSVKSPATEGVRDDNAFRIGHGCAGDRPVVAQSIVFPTDAPEIATSDPNVVVGDLSEVVLQGSIAGLAQSIQDRSIFGYQDEIVDANGNVVGFQARKGSLSPKLVGRVPFQFSAPRFVAESCARRLRIEIAVADICSAQQPILDPQKVNLWMPDNGSIFASLGRAAGVEGIGDPAILTVQRNLATNPLAAECGAGLDVTVTPSAAQLDRDLPIRNYWCFKAPR